MSNISIFIIVVFNLAVLIAVAAICRDVSLKELLSEKSLPPPTAPNVCNSSLSQFVSGLGAVVLTAFFWAIANVILVKTLGVPDQTAQIKELVDSIGTFFAAGAALFAPDAFNQLGQLFK